MFKLCECGCGNPAPIVSRNDFTRGRIKGQAMRFISGHYKKLTPDLTGLRFGRLTVAGRAEKPKHIVNNKSAFFLCKCDCGNNATIRAEGLRDGSSQSCGCLQKELVSKRKPGVTHGMSRDKVYAIWHQMIQRCENPNSQEYHNYGGRGITVCDRWHQFENFFEDMGHPVPPRISIDRKNNDKNYEPSNCKWSTRKEQNNNKRTNVFIEFNGQRKTRTQWAADLHIDPTTLKKRLLRGWSYEKALTTPALSP